MALALQIIRDEIDDVNARLSELRLTRNGLLEVARYAMTERANATADHPANSAGTMAYQSGTFGLRQTFRGPHWVRDRTGGLETIRCDALKIRIAFANVDLACVRGHDPKPRSHKGAGAERASGTLDLFDDALPRYVPETREGWQLYYLMMDERGEAELTRPIVSGGTFKDPLERIFLTREDDATVADPAADPIDFDPEVARKT